MILQVQTRWEECGKHGGFEAKNFFGTAWTRCPKCVAEQDAADAAAQSAAETAAKVARWEKALGEAGIPQRFQDRTLSTYIAYTDGQARALAWATGYVKGFPEVLKTGRSAVLIGKPGTGKTHIACGIGLALMAQGRTVLLSTVYRMVQRITDTYDRRSSETRAHAVAVFADADLLMLDEVGMQRGTDEETRIVFDILNTRYERCRPVILMSNSPLPQVCAHLGERVWDRLKEGGGQVIPFDWNSWRR